MKRMIACVVLACLLLNGCAHRTQKVILQQPLECVESINLQIRTSTGNPEIYGHTYTISLEQKAEFLRRIGELEVRKRNPPTSHKGIYVIEITYLDGAVEYIGSDSISYQSESKVIQDGWYYVPDEQMCSLLMEYMGPLNTFTEAS